MNTSKESSPVRGDLRKRFQQAKHYRWAEYWLSGHAYCPVCGSEDLKVGRTHTAKTRRVNDWRCAEQECIGRWQVELRNQAVRIERDVNGRDTDWYERVVLTSTRVTRALKYQSE
jgi:hypothetical protein